MKKFYVLLFFAAFTTGLMAQVEVTFSVDMNVVGASTDGVFVTGDWMSEAFGGDDWNEPSTNTDAQMTDSDGDGIYTLTVTLPAGDYAYKYANGISWPNAEAGGGSDNYQADLSGCDGTDNGFGGYNRNITIPDEAAFALPTYGFNSCDLFVNVDDLSTISSISITPNPATNFAIINYTNVNNANHDVLITSLTGQVVKQFNNVTDSSLRIETTDLTAGMYFVTFRNELGELGSEKLIVQ